jgi:hypothetical protein
MNSRRFSIKLTLTLVACVALGLCAWRPMRESFAMAELKRTWRFGYVEGVGKWARDPHLSPTLIPAPSSSSTRPAQWAQKVLGEVRWQHSYNNGMRFFVEGPIESVSFEGSVIDVGDDDAVHNDIAVLLSRFGSLRKLSVKETHYPNPFSVRVKVADVKRLCTAARALPRLESLTLSGNAVNEHTMAPLRGHPSLRTIALLGRHSTPTDGLIELLRSLPALEVVRYDYASIPGPRPLTIQKATDALRAALPNVKVESGHSDQ